MAGIVQTDITPVGHNGKHTIWLATSTDTKVNTGGADAARLTWAGVKGGDVFHVSCTDGLLSGVINGSTGAIAA